MKSKFLVNLKNNGKDKWVAKCASANIQVESNSKDEALSKIEKEFKQFLTYEGSSYISRWKGNHVIVNCPEGQLLLPVDIWKCKLNGETCPTQAQVFLNQEDKFRYKCAANEKKKEQILSLIKAGNYDGFHHVIGREKCVLCPDGKEYFKYHYPWEINGLYQYFDVLNDDFRVHFLKSGINLNAYSGGLCPLCFIDVISKLNLATGGIFEMINLDFYARTASAIPNGIPIRFRRDYGLHIRKSGIVGKPDQLMYYVFASIPLMSVCKVEDDLYCVNTIYSEDNEEFMLTVDLGPELLENLLDALPPGHVERIRTALSRQPYHINFLSDAYTIGIIAKPGEKIHTNAKESYCPFEAVKFT